MRVRIHRNHADSIGISTFDFFFFTGYIVVRSIFNGKKRLLVYAMPTSGFSTATNMDIWRTKHKQINMQIVALRCTSKIWPNKTAGLNWSVLLA